ncbi:hypothetical protein Avbf_07788 [Armadillidium vulgare]|nr:hypothetical protein Avbf_07788 [Armadillidium vulgare]
MEIGNFSSDIVPAIRGNESMATNSSLGINSSTHSLDNYSIKENASIPTHQNHSSQISNTAILANITILNASSLITNELLRNGSEVNISSAPTNSTMQNSTTFESVVYQKKRRQSKRFVDNYYLTTLDATNLFFQGIAKKFQYLKTASSWGNQLNQTRRNDALCQRQIRSIFRVAKFAEPSLLRCSQPESTIMVKCISNIARVTLISDSEDSFDARISLDLKNETKFILDGFKHIFYLVWWERSNKVNAEFNLKLTREMIEKKCESCNRMEATIKLENENNVCLIPVNCEVPNNQIIKLDTAKSQTVNFIRNIPIFALSINLQDSAHKIIKQEIPSGTQVDIVIEATSDAVPLGVYVRECRIRSGLKSVVILVNGCPISSFLDNFRIMRWSSDKKLVLSAKFIPFSIDDSSKNHTLGCTIMICEGMCDVQSSCQNHLKDTNIDHSRTVADVYIHTSYKVFSESKKIPGPSKNQSNKEGEVTEHIECRDTSSSITMKICYMYLVFLSLLFLFLILMIFVCLRQQKGKRNKIEEEIESPQRTFYQEECKPRRRSPNTSGVKY